MIKSALVLLLVISSAETFAQTRRETSRTRVSHDRPSRSHDRPSRNHDRPSRPTPSRDHDRPRHDRPSPRPAPRSEPGTVIRRPDVGSRPAPRHDGPVVVRREREPVRHRRPYVFRRDRVHRRHTFPGYNAAVTLGEVLITGINDADYEQVDSCGFVRGQGRISAIKLRALNDDVTIQAVDVRFEDGSVVSLPAATGHLYARGETAWVDLPGVARCVDSVQIVGSDLDFGRGARVQILGLVGRRL